MGNLKDKANPNFNIISKLEKATLEQNKLSLDKNEILANQLISTNKLCRLVESNQEDSRRWRIFDVRMSLTVLFVAVAGVSFDMIKINGNASMIAWLSNLFGV